MTTLIVQEQVQTLVGQRGIRSILQVSTRNEQCMDDTGLEMLYDRLVSKIFSGDRSSYRYDQVVMVNCDWESLSPSHRGRLHEIIFASSCENFPPSLALWNCRLSDHDMEQILGETRVEELDLTIMRNDQMDSFFSMLSSSNVTSLTLRHSTELPRDVTFRSIQNLPVLLPRLQNLKILSLQNFRYDQNRSLNFPDLVRALQSLENLDSLELVSIAGISSEELLLSLAELLDSAASPLSKLSLRAMQLTDFSQKGDVQRFVDALAQNKHLRELHISAMVGLGAILAETLLCTLGDNIHLRILRLALAVNSAPMHWFVPVTEFPPVKKLKPQMYQALVQNITLLEITVRFSTPDITLRDILGNIIQRNQAMELVRRMAQAPPIPHHIYSIILSRIGQKPFGENAVFLFVKQLLFQ